MSPSKASGLSDIIYCRLRSFSTVKGGSVDFITGLFRRVVCNAVFIIPWLSKKLITLPCTVMLT
jgi:hypothetical protein